MHTVYRHTCMHNACVYIYICKYAHVEVCVMICIHLLGIHIYTARSATQIQVTPCRAVFSKKTAGQRPWRAAMAHDAAGARGALTRLWPLWPWLLVFVDVVAQDVAPVVIPRQIPRRVGITNHAPTPGAWVVHEVKMYFTETWGESVAGLGHAVIVVFFRLAL